MLKKEKPLNVEKTVDTHPGKTAISVHFFSKSVMKIQKYINF
jgi:hypothetical protein